MGGKRPDQYAIDPGEANATDYKNRRQQEFIPEHKEKVELSHDETREREGHIPPSGENPALSALKAQKDQSNAERRASEGDAGAGA